MPFRVQKNERRVNCGHTTTKGRPWHSILWTALHSSNMPGIFKLALLKHVKIPFSAFSAVLSDCQWDIFSLWLNRERFC
jgi:hypothetical protein